MNKIKILWADDEIDLLKPQLFFLEKKGYEVITVTNGHDALDEFQAQNDIGIVFLDESMPGLTGLETLAKLKAISPHIPIVMITKNEAEDLMEEAIGSQIDDYLIKPVNPNQILLTLKKITDNKRLISEKTVSDYQQEFRNLFMEINSGLDFNQWTDIYKKIIGWELKMDQSDLDDMTEILATQKNEANNEFVKFFEKHYESWISGKEEGPVLSHNLVKEKILPHLDQKRPTVMLLLDNLRFDQWKVIEPAFTRIFNIEDEDSFYSILPTATQYSRNAIFAGMLPNEIEKNFPSKWLNDNEKGGKNLHEGEFMAAQLNQLLRKEIKFEYVKITNNQAAKGLNERALNLLQNDLSVVVYNFIDMLSHARTEMEVLKELAGDEKAYRSLTLSWFENSPIWNTLQKLAEKDVQLIVTTDHGTIRVKQPIKVVGDKDTTTNLRYKVGRNLQYNRKDVYEMGEPHKFGLPRPNISSKFIFTKGDSFFLYPNNYNHYNNYFNDTFQHGGISLEEVICPIIRMSSK